MTEPQRRDVDRARGDSDVKSVPKVHVLGLRRWGMVVGCLWIAASVPVSGYANPAPRTEWYGTAELRGAGFGVAGAQGVYFSSAGTLGRTIPDAGTLDVSIPMHHLRTEGTAPAWGVGDMVVRWQGIKSHPQQPVALRAGLGLHLPTGQVDRSLGVGVFELNLWAAVAARMAAGWKYEVSVRWNPSFQDPEQPHPVVPVDLHHADHLVVRVDVLYHREWLEAGMGSAWPTFAPAHTHSQNAPAHPQLTTPVHGWFRTIWMHTWWGRLNAGIRAAMYLEPGFDVLGFLGFDLGRERTPGDTRGIHLH